jgi:sialate O-acetylesterase
MNYLIRITSLIILLFSFNNLTEAKLLVSKLYSDHMVIQRNQPIVVWGWTDADKMVMINFNNSEYSAISNDKGDWKIILPKLEAGGPYEMVISSDNEKIIINDILIGDVWICSGQSNMEWTVANSNNAEDEIKNSIDNKLRHFDIPNTSSEKPENDILGGDWKISNPQNTGEFSATAYFFAKELRKHADVPIGLINTSWGGSRIETWMSSNSLDIKDQQELMEEVKRQTDVDYQSQLEKYQKMFPGISDVDLGMNGDQPLWTSIELDESDWKEIVVPIFWEDAGFNGLDGIGWYRTTFYLTPEEANGEFELGLGKIDDSDIAWINGIKVGEMTQAWDQPRVYKIPSKVLKEGKNVLCVRVDDTGGAGGIWGDVSSVYLKSLTLVKPLAGNWKFRIGAVKRTEIATNQIPNLLYNRMIHPILNFPIKGVIWYQGESNASFMDAPMYSKLFIDMIKDWRTLWNVGEFPFLYVQLANYLQPVNQPSESSWAILRESQTDALSLPNTGQAVIIDIGDANDVHPRDKQNVGLRLSLAARKIAYGENIIFSGPTYRNSKIKKGKMIITFNNVGSGLVSKDKYGYLKGFVIAGADKNFVWAKAEIEKNKVIVWNDKVKNPKYVRYGWADNPDDANLYNVEGLPACPFRTDKNDR